MACRVVMVLLVGCLAMAVRGDDPVPVSELDVEAYMGRWYQAITNANAMSVSQPNSTCSTVEYGIDTATRIVEDNRFRKVTPNGELDRTTGYADLTETTGVLMVKFDNIPTAFKYAIIALGPLDAHGQYSWAVVTDERKASLYGLVRSMDIYTGDVKTEMLDFIEERGFTSDMAKPIDVYHGSDCIYPESFDPIVLVTAFDPAMIVGNHFLMYDNKNINDKLFMDSYCATLQLEAVNDTTLMLKTSFRKSSPKGTEAASSGHVYATANPAIFDVTLGAANTDFQVIKTGPVTDNMYPYVVMTDKLKSNLYVAARDPEAFTDNYADDVMEFVEQSGFNGLTTSPLAQYQGSDCRYPDGFTTGGAQSLVSLGLAALLAVTSLRLLL